MVGQLSATDPDNGARPGSFSDDYQLTEIPANQTVLLNVDSSDFDTLLQIIDLATGSVIDFNDDAVPGLTANSQVVLIPSANATYLARVTSAKSQVTGSYTLTTQLLNQGAGSIVGTVWHDVNGNGTRELAETGFPDQTVFLDSNGNGSLDSGEPSTLTDWGGRYLFTNLAPGTYTIDQIIPTGYVQTFPTESALQSVDLSSIELTEVKAQNLQDTSSGRIVVAGSDPNDYVVEPGEGFDGVVKVLSPLIGSSSTFSSCTGALLSTGHHILTAAHCLTDYSGVVEVQNSSAIFHLPSGEVTVDGLSMFIHPDWSGGIGTSADLAIIELTELAPPEAERYPIYRQFDEVGQVIVKVGYGLIGTGDVGWNEPNFNDLKLAGMNQIDALNTNSIFIGSEVPNTQLLYDFDNGLAANDVFGLLFGISDLGLGLDEVNTAKGDSGGPTFINNQIAGVTHGGGTASRNELSPDIDSTLNSSFGEFGMDTRVSVYASWVDEVLGQVSVPLTAHYKITLEADEVATLDFGSQELNP